MLKDRYRALKPIGQGSFGRTYLAANEHLPSKPYCVIKQFLTKNSTTAAKLFQEEAERLKVLGSDDQIPSFIDYVEQEQQRYIVQEYVAGKNLEQELKAEGARSEEQILSLLLNILPVLDFVHQNHVIHRDIKPENIIRRDRDRQLVLVDFGAAKYATGTALARTGTTIGTAAYVAPEQVAGRATFASDLYSLGVTCIHLLTEMEPFDLYSTSEDRWVWRDYLPQPLDPKLGQVIDRLLERATSRRYQQAAAVLEDLTKSAKAAVPVQTAVPIYKTRAARIAIVASTIGLIGLGSLQIAKNFQPAIQFPTVHLPERQSRPHPDPSPTPKSESEPHSSDNAGNEKLPYPPEVMQIFKLVFSIFNTVGAVTVFLLLWIAILKLHHEQSNLSEALTPVMNLVVMMVLVNVISRLVVPELSNFSATVEAPAANEIELPESKY